MKNKCITDFQLMEGEELKNLALLEYEDLGLPKVYLSNNLKDYFVSTSTYTIIGYFDSEAFEFVYQSQIAYENFFNHVAYCYKGKMVTVIAYNQDLSRKIYSGADMFLMPSKFEPCGLGQMIAMRYGTLPLVRETGGLKDTVIPYNEYENIGDGFSFHDYNADDMLYADKLSKKLRSSLSKDT